MNQEIEKLIDIALVDGVIEERERQVIRRKAEKLGEDPDEAEMLLNAKLHELQKAQSTATPKIRKCPHCGATYPAGTTVCPECGYEYLHSQANTASETLARGILKIYDQNNINKETTSKVVSYIENFPIPSNKEDLMEFLTTMSARKNTEDKILANAYRNKMRETINKVEALYSGDSSLQTIVQHCKREDRNHTIGKILSSILSNKLTIIIIVAIIIYLFLLVLKADSDATAIVYAYYFLAVGVWFAVTHIKHD